VIGALATLLYAHTESYDFTFDDVAVVQLNPVVRNAWWWDAVSGPYWPEQMSGANNWRPFATLSFAFEWWVVDGEEKAALARHHSGNAALYGLTVLALFPIARRWCRSVKGAWAACAIFAVHPAHTQVVAPVVGRTDLLAALGGLTMCAAFWRFRESENWRWLALARRGLALGLGGKESAAALVLLLPVADILWHRLGVRELFGRAGIAYVPLVAVSVLYISLRVAVLGDHTFTHEEAWSLGWLDRLVFAARNSWLSLGLLLFPLRFHHVLTTLPTEAAVLYPLPDGLMKGVWLAAAIPLWLGFAPLAKTAPRAALLWFATLLPWVPTSGLLPIGGGASMRFLFLSSAFGACAVVVFAQWLVTRRPSLRAAVPVAGAVWGVVFVVLSWVQTSHWRNNETFFRSILDEEPRSAAATNGVGIALASKGERMEARQWFERAIDLAGDAPYSFKFRENLAMTFEAGPSGRRFGADAPLERAVALYEDALRVKPDALRADLSLARASTELAKRDALSEVEKKRHLRRALESLRNALDHHGDSPGRFVWHQGVSELAVVLGDDALARRHLSLAAAVRADRKPWVLDHQGRLEWSREKQRAIFLVEEALSMAPPPDEEQRLRNQLRDLRAL